MIASVELQVVSRLLTSDDQNEIDTLLSFGDEYYTLLNKQIAFIQNHAAKYGTTPDVFTFRSEFPDCELVDVSESLEYLVNEMRKNRQHIILLEMVDKLSRLESGDVVEAWNYIGSQCDLASELNESKPMNIVAQAQERADQVLEYSKQQRIPTGFPEIDKIMYGGLSTVEELVVIIARTNSGKAQPLWSNVLTPTGWKKMGDVKVGDVLVGKNNDNGRVVQIFPQGEVDYYRVNFDDGTFVECCGNHLWEVLDSQRRRTEDPNYEKFLTLTTDEIRNSLDRRYSVELCGQVEFDVTFDRDNELDPYLLGVLLGDGGLRDGGVVLHCPDEEVWNNILPVLSKYGCHRGGKNNNRISGDVWNHNFVKDKLAEYGLLGHKSVDKFIPHQYLTAPIDVRLSLLSGLLDTDGYAIKNSPTWEFDTASDRLAKDFDELARSLGLFVHKHSKSKSGYKTPDGVYHKCSGVWHFLCRSTFNPFRLERKGRRWSYRTEVMNRSRLRRNCKKIKSVDYVGKTECQCVLLDNWTHTYITDGYTVTHNTWILTKMMETAQANGFPVLYYSPEMQSSLLSTRFDTWRAHFKNNELFTGKYTDEYIRYIKELEHEETPAYIIEDKDMPDGVSVRTLTPLVKRYGIKLLIIDGLSYMKDDQKALRDTEKYKNICADLFNLSKKFGCAVAVTMQANRATLESKDENGDPFPTIYNAEGSDHPARIATQVFAVRQIFETHTLDIRLEKSRNAANTKPVVSYVWEVNTGHVQHVEDGSVVQPDQTTAQFEAQPIHVADRSNVPTESFDEFDDDDDAGVAF